MKTLIAVVTSLLPISVCHAQSPSRDPKLSMSGYGCTSKQEFVKLDTLAMRGHFKAYRKAQASAFASGASVTLNKGQRVLLDQRASLRIPELRKEAILQVQIPGTSEKYWILGIQLSGMD